MKLSSSTPILAAVFSIGLLTEVALANSLTAKDFFAAPEISTMRVSPDGQTVIYTKETEDNIVIYRSSDGDSFAKVFDYRMHVEDKPGYLGGLAWIDNQYLAMSVAQEVKPVAELKDTRYKTKVLILDISQDENAQTNIREVKTSGSLVNALPNQSGTFLYAKNGVNSRVFKLSVDKLGRVGQRRSKTQRVDGGQFISRYELAKLKGYAFRWYMHADEVVGVLLAQTNGELALKESSDNGKSWTKVKVFVKGKEEKKKNWWQTLTSGSDGEGEDQQKEEYDLPLSYAGEPGHYYISRKEEGSPESLLKTNYRTGETDLIYQSSGSDIYRITTDFQTSELSSVVTHYSRGEPRYIYFGEATESIIKPLRKRGYDGYMAVINGSLDQRRHVVYNFSSSNPGRFLLYDSKLDRVLAERLINPVVSEIIDSKLTVDRVGIDDLEVEYFLSEPNNRRGAGPLVVIPHGGPIGVMDTRVYDPLTQYLVYKNFSVLQVNYRGSSGYGDAFIEAGKKQWGSGMLMDIQSVTEKVATQLTIDERRVCVIGGSYGGYAALALPMKFPSTYKCLSAFAAVTDLQLFTSQLSASEKKLDWLATNVGDPKTEAEYLESISPAYNAERLSIPVLIVHGEQDRVVDAEHYHRMLYALETHDVPYEAELLPKTGHGFEDHIARARYYERVVTFVQKHIGF